MQPLELTSPKPPYITDSTIDQSRTMENSSKKKRVSLCKKLEVVYIESFKKFNIPQAFENSKKKKSNEIKCNCMVF